MCLRSLLRHEDLGFFVMIKKKMPLNFLWFISFGVLMSCGSWEPCDEPPAIGGSSAACLCWKLSVRFLGGLTRQKGKCGYSSDVDAGQRTGAFLASDSRFHKVIS